MAKLPLAFSIVAMEGPDRYSQAGGLGVRVAHLSRALAKAGYPTDLFFVGAPDLPPRELRDGVQLHRLAQEISRQFPRGIYHGEEVKRRFLEENFPAQLVSEWVAPTVERGLTPVLLFEEWHTASWVRRVSDLLWQIGIRDRCLLVWNANNQFGFDQMDWPALAYTASVTTISRYMRVLVQARGIDPIIIPNGIPRAILKGPQGGQGGALMAAAAPRSTVLKIGRFHPDKRWLQAIRAMALLRTAQHPVRMVARGGGERYGAQVMDEARDLGLSVQRWDEPIAEVADLVRALRQTAEVDILELGAFLPESLLPALYNSSLAVLANSGFEPFGLVGLETMAARGVAVVGATGEDYARHLHNSLVVQTDDPAELAFAISQLEADPQLVTSIRRAGRATAATYTWDEVIAADLIPMLPMLARRQLARWPGPELIG
ncbi:MAG: glycosyltransferase [Candidatus Dormibacteraeota bacterium]|nr:glycosyltransferase [Candidatus Dormibacteraeota bacterium]